MTRQARGRFALVAIAGLLSTLVGAATASAGTYREQQGHDGVNTFTQLPQRIGYGSARGPGDVG